MAIFRSKRLRCFYCGELSNTKSEGQVRQFRCEQCEAVNHLDRNGQITDPPAPSISSTPTAPRFAQSAPIRGSSPPPSSFATSSESIFCVTCLKNQHFLRENLAAYQPPEHLSLDAQATSAKDYQQRLEQRYPQVCGQCAPRARERIKRAGYVAKTDHLRRMMQRTRERAYGSKGWDWIWRDVVFRVGALGWWGSIIAQVLWHILAAKALYEKRKSQEIGLRDEDELDLSNLQPSFRVCLAAAMTGEKGSDACSAAIATWMPWVMGAALITFLWNNQLWKKYLGAGGRMVGLLNYYVIQVILLASRALAWSFLSETKTLEGWIRGLDIAIGAHAAMTVFITLCALLSLSAVKLDNTSLVSFQLRGDEILPDIPTAQATPQPPSRSTTQRFSTAAVTTPRVRRPFHIDSLAPNSAPRPQASTKSIFQTQQSTPLQSPTPPASPGEDPDAMDWAPSANASFASNADPTRSLTSSTFHASQNPIASAHHYNLRSRTPASHRQPLAPLPNTMPLPPAPNARMPHPRAPVQARTPLNPFTESTQQQRHQTLFTPHRGVRSGSPASTDTPDDRTELGSAFGGDGDENSTPRTETLQGKRRKRTLDLAPTRLFLEKDKADTGLEGMFDEVFRLGSASGSGKASKTRQEVGKKKAGLGMGNAVEEPRGAGGIFGVSDVTGGTACGEHWLKGVREGDDEDTGFGWLGVGGMFVGVLLPGAILTAAVLTVKGF